MFPQAALNTIHALNAAGFEAYAVGGCVRDMLRRITAADIDITTSALPHEVMAVFSAYRVIPTGLKHGTVTVLVDDQPFEITTYRRDGQYSDGRHPDAVEFTTSLTDDLSRRDFTVNAMAFHPKIGIVDPFGGQADLRARIIRCVGDADKRFDEDALRMARLVRFMSVLDFDVEDNTARAAHTALEKLDAVAAERKRIELAKLLTGDGFLRAATVFPDILCRMVPCLLPLCGFEQHTPHHDHDIYTHTVRAVQFASKDPIVRLAALFHDVGKAETFTLDDNGIGHFYGHAAVSERLAKDAMTDLRFDNDTIRAVLPLIHHHGSTLTPDRRCVRRRIAQLGETGVRRLIDLKTADVLACRDGNAPPDFRGVIDILEQLITEKACVSLSSLAIGGRDLLALGYPAGPLIGEILNTLFGDVLAEQCENTRDVLLHRVKERWPYV